MRIAWFTPLDENSGIGRYSVAATESLRKCGIEVEIFHMERENILATTTPLNKFNAQDVALPELLSKYNFTAYNIGDNLQYHEQIYEISKIVPGIVIVHDIVMHHFVAGYYLYSKKDTEAYIQKAESLYGNKDLFRNSISGSTTPIWDDDQVMLYPFFEPFVENALGVICHSKYAQSYIRKFYHGSDRVLYFPYCGLSDYSEMAKSDDSGRLRVFVVCNNPNKLTHVVLNSLGHNAKLSEKFDVKLVGLIDMQKYKEIIVSLIDEHGLKDRVSIMGRLSDSEFVSELSMSDIVVNLRDPPMEGASSALMEQLWAGKPTVVLNHGFYGEMPDDCVYKIDTTNPEEGLAEALTMLSENSSFRKSLGIRARNYAQVIFNANVYAEGFKEFLEELVFNQPIEHLIMHITREMQMMRVPPKSSLPRTVAREIGNMFSS